MAEGRAELAEAATPEMEPAPAHDATPAVHEEEPFPLDAETATVPGSSGEDLPAEPGPAG
jgi:hypothetical protein